MAHTHSLHHEHLHHHEHSHHHGRIMLIVVSVILLVAAMLIEHRCGWQLWQLLLVYLIPYLLVGHETLKEAIEGVAHGDPFNEHFLMSVATLGALSIGFMPGAEPEFAEAVFVMLFFQIGEFFEGYAEGQSQRNIESLAALRPDHAVVLRDGQMLTVSPQEVAVGETIIVSPGERIPMDGVVVKGTSPIDTSALTGESVPRKAVVGDEVASGCICLSGVIEIRTTHTAETSMASRIIDLVSNASERKSKSEAFITRFARVYTPIVVYAALALAIVPPLLSGDFGASFPMWLHRALIFLVVSCPCALVISVPLTFFGGIGGASRQGILIKGSSYLDVLSKVRTLVFDKTGTLTEGVFAVTAVHPEQYDEKQLLHLAAHVERHSSHPIAEALCLAFPEAEGDGCVVSDVEELAGLGVRAVVEGKVVSVGNAKLMDLVGAQWRDCHHVGTIVHVAIDGDYAGHIVISDKVKTESSDALSQLRSMGVERLVMLSGDREAVVASVSHSLGIDDYSAELLPADKVERMRQILVEGREVRHTSNGLSLRQNGTARGMVGYVGDGINDAPVLALADVGIAMGGLGSEAAIESADVVLMDDRPTKIAQAIRIARRTLRIARENVAFAIGVKALVLLLAAVGVATMWMAAFADVGVTVIAVLNAMRMLRKQ